METRTVATQTHGRYLVDIPVHSRATLVGFHGLHVTGGVIVMAILLGLALKGQITEKNQTGVQLVSWYWHFVDVVWIGLFLVIYVLQ